MLKVQHASQSRHDRQMPQRSVYTGYLVEKAELQEVGDQGKQPGQRKPEQSHRDGRGRFQAHV